MVAAGRIRMSGTLHLASRPTRSRPNDYVTSMCNSSGSLAKLFRISGDKFIGQMDCGVNATNRDGDQRPSY
jgi:hypothetical protein